MVQNSRGILWRRYKYGVKLKRFINLMRLWGYHVPNKMVQPPNKYSYWNHTYSMYEFYNSNLEYIFKSHCGLNKRYGIKKEDSNYYWKPKYNNNRAKDKIMFRKLLKEEGLIH